MEFTNYQKELIRELRRVSVNTQYHQDFTLSINKFLLDLIQIKKNKTNHILKNIIYLLKINK